MSFSVIGFIVGLLMGITGAGGAIIAIPLFQLLNGSSLKEATTLSLITVLLGTGINLVSQMKQVKWKVALGLAVAGTVANYFSMPLKAMLTEIMIAFLLVIIGTFSLWSVWNSPPHKKQTDEKRISPFIILLTGLFLGLITTLTGLGGGVLLIPLLLYVFSMDYEKAIPTSLASIFFISLSSILIQGTKTLELIGLSEILYIIFGGISAFLFLRFALRNLNESRKLTLRKYVFTFATATSLMIVILKTL